MNTAPALSQKEMRLDHRAMKDLKEQVKDRSFGCIQVLCHTDIHSILNLFHNGPITKDLDTPAFLN